MSVHPGKRAARRHELVHEPGGGEEIPVRVLRVDPAFQRYSARHHVLLPEGQRAAGGHSQLLGDNVDAGGHLGDRMFHLDPGIHLDEVKISLVVDQKFERTGADIAAGASTADGCRANVLGQPRRQPGGRRLLDQLLPAALHRTVPLPQADHIPVVIGQNLHLDMPSALQETFDIDATIAKCRLRRGTGSRVRTGQLTASAHDRHSPPATAGNRLDDDRISDPLSDFLGLQTIFDSPRATRQHRQAGRRGHLAGLRLVAQPAHHVCGRADENESLRLAHLGEIGILGEEAVAGMDRVDAGPQRGFQNSRRVKIAAPGRRGSNVDTLVGETQRGRVAISGGMHHHRTYAQLTAGTGDPQRDLTAIGDQNSREHCHPPEGNQAAGAITNSGWPYSTDSP